MDENNKVIVIDCGYFMHRAIFAYIAMPQMIPTFTFSKMILACLRKIGVDLNTKIIISEDFGTWRKSIDPLYKGQRKDFRESKKDAEWWKDTYNNFNDYIHKLDMALPWHFVKIYHCFTGHTRIDTPNGIIQIKFLKKGNKVYSWNEKTRKIEISTIKKVFISETNDRYLIKFGQFNSKLNCTGNHPFYTQRGWIKTKDLKLDDTIYTKEDFFLDSYKGDWNKIGYIHGYLNGDGTNHNKTYSMEFTSKDLEGLKRIVAIFRKTFNQRKIRILNDSRNYYKLTISGRRTYDSFSKNIRKIDNLDYKKGWLAGFYDAEGTLTKRNKYRMGIIGISNTNKELISYCISILKELNIDYKIYKFIDKRKYTCGYIYRIDINKQSHVSEFFEKINTAIERKRPNTIKNGLTIQTINHIKSRKKLKVYNLEVTPNNTYFANTCLVHNCESDDIAAVCCKVFPDKEIILMTNDEDWNMLTYYSNVKVFSPTKKQYKIIKDPMMILLKKIQGDISDNLLTKPSSEAEFDRRKKIVDLINLPHEIETPIKEALLNLPIKNMNLNKVPFKTIREEIKKLYNL